MARCWWVATDIHSPNVLTSDLGSTWPRAGTLWRMRAAVYRRYGPPSVVHVESVPMPVPQVDELLVRVIASTVNRTDCGFLSEIPYFVRLLIGLRAPQRATREALRKFLDCEFAGLVEQVGAGVTSFTVGQRVFGYNGVKFGGHAEYLTIAEGGLVAEIPASMS